MVECQAVCRGVPSWQWSGEVDLHQGSLTDGHWPYLPGLFTHFNGRHVVVVSTEVRNDVSTEVRNDVGTEVRNDVSTEVRNDVSTEVRYDVSTEERKEARTSIISAVKLLSINSDFMVVLILECII